MDTFLISRQLYLSGGVTLFEVLDFIEHGSDHCPIYLRVKLFPKWQKRIKKPARRILKSSGLKSLQMMLEVAGPARSRMIDKVLGFFSQPSLDWSSAVTRSDMNDLWCLWVRSYDLVIEKLIGTRPASDATWGRKFSLEVRKLCKDASMARSQFIKAKRDFCNYEEYLARWQNLRSKFIRAWERSDKEYQTECVERAVKLGSNAVWRLLNNNRTESTRSLLTEENSFLTNPSEIVEELKRYHYETTKEYKAVPTGDNSPLERKSPFRSSDVVLVITDELVVVNVMKL